MPNRKGNELDFLSDSSQTHSDPEALKTHQDPDEEFDTFKPFPEIESVDLEKQPLTIRAVIVGVILGSVVNASNLYLGARLIHPVPRHLLISWLGLKTGFTFGASMVGAVIGFGILRALSKLPPNTRFLGGNFGPQENSIIQAAASGAGGLGILFVGAWPAMYQLNLLSANPVDDFRRILAMTFVCSFFGLFFAVPLRKFFILHVGRELNLVFPTRTPKQFFLGT